MRIMFLNTWNGREAAFDEFITHEAPHTHVFCFQEAYDELRTKCALLIPGYSLLTGYKEVSKDDNFPQATYIRRDVELLSWAYALLGQKNTGLGIFSEVKFEGHRLGLCNFHGTAYPGDKLDSPARLEQSEGLLAFFANTHGSRVIGGDFNLDPNTESIRKLENGGFRSLYIDGKPPITRNENVWKRYPENRQLYSDYVFVSPEVRVKEFKVAKELVSDHQPLILEIER